MEWEWEWAPGHEPIPRELARAQRRIDAMRWAGKSEVLISYTRTRYCRDLVLRWQVLMWRRVEKECRRLIAVKEGAPQERRTSELRLAVTRRSIDHPLQYLVRSLSWVFAAETKRRDVIADTEFALRTGKWRGADKWQNAEVEAYLETVIHRNPLYVACWLEHRGKCLRAL